MTTHRNALALILVAALAATSITPSLARPNDGRFARSSEALKKADLAACADILKEVKLWEAKADKVAGTKEASKYSKEADEWWAAGKSFGCSWAS